MKLTPDQLHRYCSAFRLPKGTDLSFLEEPISRGYEITEDLVGGLVLEKDHHLYEGIEKRYVAFYAALYVIAERNVVLTTTGFGVVSNQNVVPASKERTDALILHLEREKSDAYWLLIQQLARTPGWKDSPRRTHYFHNLFTSPAIYRAVGITYQGRPVYDEEFQALQLIHDKAELAAIDVMGMEQYRELVRMDWLSISNARSCETHYQKLRILTRRYIAQIIKHNLDGVPLRQFSYNTARPVYDARRYLIRYLDENKNSFLKYLNSPEYKAHLRQSYENKKNTPVFFFH